MSKKVFNFKTQIAIGDKGEKAFLEAYVDLGPIKSEDRAVDFHLKDGKGVELKTDDYAMEATENFFMEITSHGKLGGPYRAQQDKIEYFVYYFIKNKTFFWFDTNKLCSKLDELILTKRFKIKSIRNHGWTAEGYAIPRADLKCVQIKEDVFT